MFHFDPVIETIPAIQLKVEVGLSSSTAIAFAEMHVTMPPIANGASSTAFANVPLKRCSFCNEALAALKIDGIRREEIGFVFST